MRAKASELSAIGHGRPIRVAGLVTGRQRPGSAAGVTFVTLEDETGNINLLIWQQTARAQRRALLSARLLEVSGVLEQQEGVIHVIVGKLHDRSPLIEQLPVPSRDFH